MDITIFDLISGKALNNVLRIDAQGGWFEVNVEAGQRSWGRLWGGGGSYALGLLKEVKASNSSDSISSKITASPTRAASFTSPVITTPVGDYIVAGLGGASIPAIILTMAPQTTMGNVSITSGNGTRSGIAPV